MIWFVISEKDDETINRSPRSVQEDIRNLE